MEAIIFLVWVLEVIALPVIFISVAYYVFVPGSKAVTLLGKLVLAIILYLAATFLMIYPMFVMIYAGAHSKPVGEALSFNGRLTIVGLVFLYSVTGWLLSSFVKGGFIGMRHKASE
jgi:hypothetical protein